MPHLSCKLAGTLLGLHYGNENRYTWIATGCNLHFGQKTLYFNNASEGNGNSIYGPVCNI